MIKNLLATIGTTALMSKAGLEPLEFIVVRLEKLAWGLEELANITEAPVSEEGSNEV